jgi:hypothetical protein
MLVVGIQSQRRAMLGAVRNQNQRPARTSTAAALSLYAGLPHLLTAEESSGREGAAPRYRGKEGQVRGREQEEAAERS